MIPDDSPADEVGLVVLEDRPLGPPYPRYESDFFALKDNVEQVMANLQDGLMLFTPDSRVVLVSASAEKFLDARATKSSDAQLKKSSLTVPPRRSRTSRIHEVSSARAI